MARKLSDIASQGEYAPRTPGVYDMRVEKIEPFKPSSGGHPQIRIEMKFLGGKYDGKNTSIFRMLSDNMQWKLAKELTAAGLGEQIECPDTNESSDWAEALRPFLGAFVKVKIEHREYQGKPREELSIVGGDHLGTMSLSNAGV